LSEENKNRYPKWGNFKTEVTLRIIQYMENGVSKSNEIRQVHCFKEDSDYDAPKIKLPGNEIFESNW